MTIRFSFILLIIFVLLWGCNPNALLTKKESSSNVDSVLFYQQNDISDPFIDAILTDPPNSATIQTTIIPAPVPTESFRLIDGFRIQVHAGTDSLSALTTKYKAASVVQEPVYIDHQQGLFKIQVGDLPFRIQADSLNRVLKNNGFPGSWVVARKIRVPVVQETEVERPETVSGSDSTNFRFRIQVLATSDENRARQLVDELKSQYALPAAYEPSGTMFKIFLGRFMERADADTVLAKVRASGFPDAWLVY